MAAIGLGAIAATVARATPAASRRIDARQHGARGDGVTDDTLALQSAFDLARPGDDVFIPAGDYRVDATRSLSPRSGTRVVMDTGTMLRALPNDRERTAIIDLTCVEDVRIEGGRLAGDRQQHAGGGEWGHGIRILSSRRVTIVGTVVVECWGDGVYIGALGAAGKAVSSEAIHLVSVVCLRNRRQGLSITVARDILLEDCTFARTAGTPPASGIDIEPQRQGAAARVRVVRCNLTDNDGCGIECHGAVSDVLVDRCTIQGNRTHGVLASGVSNLRVTACDIQRQGRQGLVLDRAVDGAVVDATTLRDNGTQWHATPSGADPRLNWKIDPGARGVRLQGVSDP